MQVVKEELQFQQMVLKHLGFYRGPIDGIWSADSISAKRQFEFTIEYAPAIPTNGLPFGASERLPKGIHFKRDGGLILLTHKDIRKEDEQRMLGVPTSTVASRDPMISNEGPMVADSSENVSTTPIDQVIDEPQITHADEQAELSAVADMQVQQKQNPQQQQKPHHQHNQNKGHRR